MNNKWTYEDIIDLEYFFQQDADTNSAMLHSRDRKIYLNHLESQPEKETADNSSLLSIWLRAQRQSHEKELQGTIAHEAHSLLRLILLFFGIFTGASSGLFFFSYSGTTPVNVLHFLVLFVLTQLILAILFMSRAGLITLGLRSVPESLTVRLLTTLFTRLATSLGRQGNKHLTAEQRLELQAHYGRLKMVNRNYSNLLQWTLFQLIQLTAICFNLGLLVATFFKIIVSDVAFGWQSTLQFSSQTLHTIIAWLAVPWSWLFAEGIGYPTLAQIEGSRIVLKEGIANLQTPDLVSWWPFLLLTVIVYGLTLRLSFYGYGWFQQMRAGSQLQFDTPVARQVIRRMQTPLVSTQAQPETRNEGTGSKTAEKQAAATVSQHISANPIILLLPDEIYNHTDLKRLSEITATEGFLVETHKRFMIDYQADQLLLKELSEHNWSNSAGILIVMEAWMPPLVSFISYIKQLRKNVGTNLPIMLRLIGKPLDTTVLTPVLNTTERQVWRQKIAALGDPYLEIDDLIKEVKI